MEDEDVSEDVDCDACDILPAIPIVNLFTSSAQNGDISCYYHAISTFTCYYRAMATFTAITMLWRHFTCYYHAMATFTCYYHAMATFTCYSPISCSQNGCTQCTVRTVVYL